MRNYPKRTPFRRKSIRGRGFLHPNPILAAHGLSENFVERFWKFVNKTDHCWLWTGSKNAKGYGQISRGFRVPGMIKAHRASWLIHFGEIPEGKCVLHDCRPSKDCAACINPAHLWLGTILENNADQAEKGMLSPPPKFYGKEWHRIHDK